MSTVYIKSFEDPRFNGREIMRYAGVKIPTPETDALLDECLALAKDKFVYKVCFCKIKIDMQEGFLTLGSIKTASNDLKKNLSGCKEAYIFAATVGFEIDRLVARFGAVSPAKALMLQAIGAERIESLCDAFNGEISALAKAEGKHTRPRFSAGYGDLPLEAQKDIFELLDCPKRIGVTLNESLLMSPTKSVTAIIGICENEE